MKQYDSCQKNLSNLRAAMARTNIKYNAASNLGLDERPKPGDVLTAAERKTAVG